MRRWLGAMLLCPALAHAQGADVDAVRIVEHGIYALQHGNPAPAHGTAMGYVTEVFDYKLVERTDTICARLELSFGIEFEVEGRPRGQTVVMDLVTRYPEPGVTNTAGRTFARNEFNASYVVGLRHFRSFTFEESWELVPGRWTLEFHYAGRKVGEKAFDVRDCRDISQSGAGNRETQG